MMLNGVADLDYYFQPLGTKLQSKLNQNTRCFSQEIEFITLWPSDAIRQNKSGSILAQVMAWCLKAPSHYLNHCVFIMSIHIPVRAITLKIFQPSIIEINLKIIYLKFHSLGPSDAIWCWRSWSTLVQVMACYLTAPSHYLNQCWLTISKVLWHSSRRFEDTN